MRELQRILPEWAQLFQRIPSDNKRRSEALSGAIKIKSAGKRLEKLAASLPGLDSEGGADADRKNGSLEAASLPECQAAWRDGVLGLLEVSFVVDELVTKDDFNDAMAVKEAMERLQLAADLTAALGKVFAKAELDPKASSKPTSEAEQGLPPEMLQMLEKCMAEKKGAVMKAPAAANEAEAAKMQTESVFSAVLGEEVWEAVCWRRGIFLSSYISFLLSKTESEQEAEGPNTAEEEPPVSRGLLTDAVTSFDMMLHAQGPIASDSDDPVTWQAAADGGHQDETARMLYHGVYSSSHLRGLKHLAELLYWQWKHLGRGRADAELAAVVNRKFVHVVRHIMPGAGWTADIEYERIVEMEGATLETSAFSAGLNDRPPQTNSNFKHALPTQQDRPCKGGGSSRGRGSEGSGSGGRGSGGASAPLDVAAAAGGASCDGVAAAAPTGQAHRKKKGSKGKR